MRFNCRKDLPELQEAADIASGLASDGAFWTRVAKESDFTSTSLTVAEICRRLRACEHDVEVQRWVPPRGVRGLKWRKTVAFVSRDTPNVIRYSVNFLDNPVAEMVNTLVHEFVHVVDFFHDGNAEIEFGHDTQSASGNQRSAPYRIGDLAQLHHEEGRSMASSTGLKSFGLGLPHRAFDCASGVEPTVDEE